MSKKNNRLGVFGSLVGDLMGPVGLFRVVQYCGHRLGGREASCCITPEMRHIDEIRHYRKLLWADFEAAFDEFERQFLKQKSVKPYGLPRATKKRDVTS